MHEKLQIMDMNIMPITNRTVFTVNHMQVIKTFVFTNTLPKTYNDVGFIASFMVLIFWRKAIWSSAFFV